MKDAELELARQVIQSLEAEFDPSELRSDYRRDLRALLDAKTRGEEIAVPEPVEEAPVIDLMEALKASVAAAKKEPADASRAARSRKRAAARAS